MSSSSEVSSWRELLVLLRSGDVDCAILTCEFIGETIGTGTINDLPDIFHEIITKNYVTSNDLYTRCNTAYLIRILCEEFAHLLKPLLMESSSDGDALQLSSIDVATYTKVENATCLLSGKSSYVVDATTDGNLYKKSWLSKQKKALHAMLCLELQSDDAKIAAVQFEDAEMVMEQDIDVQNGSSKDKNSTEPRPLLVNTSKPKNTPNSPKPAAESLSPALAPAAPAAPLKPTPSAPRAPKSSAATATAPTALAATALVPALPTAATTATTQLPTQTPKPTQADDKDQDQDDQFTEETWFARLVRFMILGIIQY
jgi:hypothetical protein